MTGYVSIPLVTNPDDLSADMLDDLVAAIPGYIPYDGHLSSWIFQIVARINAVTRDIASQVSDDIFTAFGRSMFGLPPVAGAAPTVLSDWTMVDDSGYTVTAGTIVGLQVTGDELVPFEVVEDFTVVPGDTVAEDIVLRDLVEGTAHNDIPAGVQVLMDQLAFVASGGVVTTADTAGGIDEEDDDEYLDRLRAELQLMSPRPILPNDFAVLARRVTGVHRALAIDGYNPVDETSDNERMVTIYAVDEDGADVSADIKDDISEALEAQREVNFVVNVDSPTYTPIDFDYTITVKDGYTGVDVVAAVDAALENFVDPAVWAGGEQNPPAWNDDDLVVRILEAAHVIYSVAGVNDLTSLEINGGTVDVDLDGVAPLPSVGVISGTVA